MSKASRRRSKIKPRGSSKAGRPRKEGDRYPNGRLKPPGPNERVLEKRRAGDAEAGEHPLDFALSQRWITEQMHRDADAYRQAFGRSHIGLGAPRLGMASLPEVVPSEELRINWSQMSDAEIVEIFDKVFGDVPPPPNADADKTALGKWREMNAHLSAAEQQEMFKVCIMGSWPFWMVKMASEHALGRQDQQRMEALFGGLQGVANVRRPKRKAEAKITPVPHVPTRSGKSEVAVRYVNEEGIEVGACDKFGRPFEVAVMRRR